MSEVATQPECEECGYREEEGMFRHADLEFRSDREIHVKWICPECGHMNKASFTYEGTGRDRPEYTRIDVFCPVCGHDDFSSTTEDVPTDFETHYVNPVCAECRTVLTIEYRAIDITWYDEHDGYHSAVAQGAIMPKTHEFPRLEHYAPLRRSVDYWYVAYDEEGGFQPIATETDAIEKMEDDDYEVHIARPTEMSP